MGTPKQSIIEVNGKRYDARTGQLITTKSAAPVARAKTAPKTKPAQTAKRVNDIARPVSGVQAVRRQVQKSQTLMRSGLKRPAPRPAVKTTKSRTVSDFRPVKPVASKVANRPNPQRQARAQSITQSKLVRKFNDFGASVQAASTQAVATTIAALPVQPVPAVPKTALKPTNLQKQKESILERGLRNANSHNEVFTPVKASKKSKRKSSRLATYAAGTLAALLLVGFIAYQNVPNIAVRYAAARSGVTASLPGYQPAGFALGHKVQYNHGQIVLSYQSNADERSYTITQRESNWNSDTLMANYVVKQSEQIQTYEDKGRTIYLYGESGATWVNGGVWYDISGDSQLTSDQLIRIATSL